jgi:hypothetical protein
MYTFTFDHASADGEGGYGAVCVDTPRGERFYIGRGFARTVLVERFPDATLTYDDAADLVRFLAGAPSFVRNVARQASVL